MLLNGLYMADPVFNIIDKYKWKYIITFKEGSMPDTYREYLCLKSLCPENIKEIKNNNIIQNYSWVNCISYRGPVFDVLQCNESKISSKGEAEDTRFVWATNFLISSSNCKKIAKGGRLRWKIENEGSGIQKNRGFNLEHPYSQSEKAVLTLDFFLIKLSYIIKGVNALIARVLL